MDDRRAAMRRGGELHHTQTIDDTEHTLSAEIFLVFHKRALALVPASELSGYWCAKRPSAQMGNMFL